MRVISGSKGGLKLFMHDGYDTRPTSDRVKEGVFSSISSYVYNAKVLDLFAGSGAIGIEALSRGAKEAFFVEKDQKAIKTLQRNIEHAGFEKESHILVGDSIQLIKKLANFAPYDIIYMDPPYHENYYESALTLLEKYDILSKNGIMVLESEKKTSLSCNEKFYSIKKTKTYGDTRITYVVLQRDDQEEYDGNFRFN